MATVSKTPTKTDTRRRKIRDERWVGAVKYLWHRAEEPGFVTIPRTLPLIGTLIKVLVPKTDASRVYIDLWGRVFDQGLVEINDEMQFAMSAGYPEGSRNVRTWQERMRTLEELGFILTSPSASRRYGFVLILHPHKVVELMNLERPAVIPSWWWSLYRERLRDIGARIPGPDEVHDLKNWLAAVGRIHPTP